MAQFHLSRGLGWLVLISAFVAAACSGEETPEPREPSCVWPETACEGACVDPTRDPLHCGGCGIACAEGEVCQEARCTTGCEGGGTLCDGRCADTRTDPANCGQCDRSCEEGQLCQEGQCVGSCAEGLVACEGGCFDTRVDARHCGSCGAACAEGELCDQGACAASCGEGLSACGGGCVDIQKDRKHCGACGVACAEGEVCRDGGCGPSGCLPEETRCGESCVDVDEDVLHCGGCNKPCPEGALCNEGACACPEGWDACDGVCVDTSFSPDHCGGCGERCDWGAVCKQGSCECEEGLTQCGSICLDTTSDPFSCGECDLVCEELPNVNPASMGGASFACLDSACQIGGRCLPGFMNCDGDWKSGCHINLMEDDQNCGDCGVSCDGHPRVEEAACQSGICRVLVCEEGFGDCDLDIQNGCEASFAANESHCGACNKPCHDLLPNVETAECGDGSCTITCEEGFHDCNEEAWDGCEAHFETDPLNCGGCGIVCDSCRQGQCLDIEGFSVGSSFICALANGDVYCWGRNSHGQLGLGQGQTADTPTMITTLPKIETLTSTHTASCAIDVDGVAHCWGENISGRLGDGTTTNRFLPVQVNLQQKVLQIALGDTHACALVEGKEVYCWGQGMYGQLGNGSTLDRLTPTKVPLTEVERISVGGEATCALRSDHTLHCWGSNLWGELGNGERLKSADSPVEITALGANVADVSFGRKHGCFLTRGAGKVLCAGNNEFGELGNGRFDKDEYVLIPTEISGLAGIVEIDAGWGWTCARDTNDEVFCWGSNEYGQLGIGSFHEQATPQRLTGMVEGVGALRAKSIDLGGRGTSCVLSSAGGGLICWGANHNDMLGNGGGSASSPVRYPW